MAKYVEWKPFYSVGAPSIDGEHQRLLEMINELYMANQAGHGHDRIQGILERLADYTIVHFDHEERVMCECGYPRLEAHKLMHAEMRRRAHEYKANPNTVVGDELLIFLKDWWVRHIQNQDKAYAPYLDAVVQQPIKMS
jgi:hemerythrin